MAAEAPAAPLEKAVHEAREAQRLYDSCPAEAKGNCVTCTPRLYAALRSLLLALDADDRLAKAEALLVEACGKLADDGPCECAADALGTCWWCRWHDRADPATRRYFAAKGDDRG